MNQHARRIAEQQLAQRTAQQVNRAAASSVVAGTGLTLLETDARKPAAPIDVALDANGSYDLAGRPIASIDVTWSPVTTDADGLELAAVAYEVWYRVEGDLESKLGASTGSLNATLSPIAPSIPLAISVRAQSSTGEWGVFSDELDIETPTPDERPLPPTAPVLTSSLGTVTVTWDGMSQDPDDGPVEAFHGLASTFAERRQTGDGDDTWVAVGAPISIASSIVDADVVVGAQYDYRLRSTSTAGATADGSASATITVDGVHPVDLGEDVQQQIDDAAADATNALSLAGTAQATADGKNQIHWSASEPDGGTYTQGDTWFQVYNGNIVGQWQLGGGGWIRRDLASDVVAYIDAGKISVGILSADRIAAGAISAAKVASGAVTTDKLAANAITAAKIAAGTITTNELAAGAVKANNIDAGAVTTAKLSATAIDGMTITGALIRTAASGARVEITSSNGLRGIDGGGTVVTSVGTNGLLTATGATITGTINATGGTFSGALTVTGSITGGVVQTSSDATAKRVVIDSATGLLTSYAAGASPASATLDSGSLIFRGAPGSLTALTFSTVGITGNPGIGSYTFTPSGGTLTIAAGPGDGSAVSTGGDLVLGRLGDGVNFIRSQAAYDRTNGGNPATSGSLGLMVVSSSGTFARSTGRIDPSYIPGMDQASTTITLYPGSTSSGNLNVRVTGTPIVGFYDGATAKFYYRRSTDNVHAPTVYGTTLSSSYRAVYTTSVDGQLGYVASKRDLKNDLGTYSADLKAWTAAAIWHAYTFKADPKQSPRVGSFADLLNAIDPRFVDHTDEVPDGIKYEILGVAALDLIRQLHGLILPLYQRLGLTPAYETPSVAKPVTAAMRKAAAKLAAGEPAPEAADYEPDEPLVEPEAAPIEPPAPEQETP